MKPVRLEEGPIRVLHIDDNEAFMRLTATSLAEEESDLEISSESDPAVVLDRLSDGDIECIVSDYQMPSMDGLALLERVREDHPGLPFILFTGHGSERVASEAISAGVTDYVAKGGGIEQFELLAGRIKSAVEQRRTERALAEAREGYEKLLEAAPDAIVLVDAETGTLLEVNEAAASLFGKSREELRGLHHTELHPPDDRDYYERVFAEHADSRGVIRDERQLSAVHDDGHEIPVEISAAPVEFGGRQVVQGIFRDLSDRKR